MPTPGEHKTVQARILEYAEAIGWTFVSREEAEQRRGFDPFVPPADSAKIRSLFFEDLLDAKLREFNPRYAEVEGALLGQFRHLHTASTAIGAGSSIRQHISQDIATKQDQSHYLAIYCDLTKVYS
ncbi:MAG: hypothetical protein WAT36_00460 [Chromatiaceae bacterium]